MDSFINKMQRLSDYLRQQKSARIIGNEKVDGIPCYVIQTPEKSTEDANVKFWITPESGFRLVQIHHQTQTRKALIKFEWQAYQLDGEQRVWFPKRAVSISEAEAEQNEIEITLLRRKLQKLSPSKMRLKLQSLNRISMCQAYLISRSLDGN